MNNFVWTDLSTLHVEAAKIFYSKLFDWMYYDASNYHMAYSKGKEAAAIFQMPDKFKKMQLASYWMPYISITDIDNVVLKAIKLGAKVGLLPFSFNEKSKIAVIKDPSGASISLCEGFSMNGLTDGSKNGQFSWFERIGDLSSEVKVFYEELFSWKFDAEGDGFMISKEDGKPFASMKTNINIPEEGGSFWIPSFNVDSLQEAKAVVLENGGEVVLEEEGSFVGKDLFGAGIRVMGMAEE